MSGQSMNFISLNKEGREEQSVILILCSLCIYVRKDPGLPLQKHEESLEKGSRKRIE